MKMSCLVVLFCDLLEVGAVFIRAVFHLFRNVSSTHHESLSGKTTKSSLTGSVRRRLRQEKLIALSYILKKCTLILPRVAVRPSNQQYKICQSGRSFQA